MSHRSVLQIHAPPFATLALVQSVGEGEGVRRMRHFLLRLCPPSTEKCFSASVDAGFILALLFHHGDLELDCVEVSTREGGGGGGGRRA